MRRGLSAMPTERKPILFPINVSLKEESGRVVEGKACGHTLAVDLLSSWGGRDSHACPLETLPFALGACFVATARTWAFRERHPNGDTHPVGTAPREMGSFA
jgi:uncharacterized OsmC-like protein